MKKLNSGFTLIELMIVVAIIGILAAVAIPQYQNYVARAQVSEALSLASGAKVAVAEYFNTNGTFPADNSTAGLTEPTDFKGNWVESVTVSVVGGNALITALFSSTDAHSKLQGGEVTLTAVDHGGSIAFACTSTGGTDITAYLPSSCADVTGDSVVIGHTLEVEGVPKDGDPWNPHNMPEDTNACWDPKAGGGSGGWVVGRAVLRAAAHYNEYISEAEQATINTKANDSRDDGSYWNTIKDDDGKSINMCKCDEADYSAAGDCSAWRG